MKSRSCTALGILVWSLTACGSSSSSPVDSGTPADTGPAKGDASHPDAVSDAGSDVTTPADAGSDAAADAVADTYVNIPFDATGYTPTDGGDAVLTQTVPETWSWVPFAGALCRDGSTTGIGINFNPASTKLVIYLEGGGACFNQLTCAGNPSSFGAADFPGRFPSASDGGAPAAGNGILDRTNSANPVKDWNMVYVPYCTGDIHAGNNPAATVPMVTGTQAFVGYNNVDLYLQRLVPTFTAATQVLLTGVSGGGFGAAANYLHVQRAFGSIPVSLLDDSGPYMEDPYLGSCLQDEVRTLWGLDSTVGADCNGHCNDPSTFFLDVARYAITGHPHDQFGLMESTDDGTITGFFGFATNNCQSLGKLSGATFTAGLDDIRTQLAASPNAGSFVFTGTDHTSLGDDNFYSRTTTNADGGTVQLTSWVTALVGGSMSNAGP